MTDGRHGQDRATVGQGMRKGRAGREEGIDKSDGRFYLKVSDFFVYLYDYGLIPIETIKTY